MIIWQVDLLAVIFGGMACLVGLAVYIEKRKGY